MRELHSVFMKKNKTTNNSCNYHACQLKAENTIQDIDGREGFGVILEWFWTGVVLVQSTRITTLELLHPGYWSQWYSICLLHYIEKTLLLSQDIVIQQINICKQGGCLFGIKLRLFTVWVAISTPLTTIILHWNSNTWSTPTLRSKTISAIEQSSTFVQLLIA